jgi:hypothetical protein
MDKKEKRKTLQEKDIEAVVQTDDGEPKLVTETKRISPPSEKIETTTTNSDVRKKQAKRETETTQRASLSFSVLDLAKKVEKKQAKAKEKRLLDPGLDKDSEDEFLRLLSPTREYRLGHMSEEYFWY